MSDNRIKHPVVSPVPGTISLFEEEDESYEISKITDFESLYRKIEKIEKLSLSTKSRVVKSLAKVDGLFDSLCKRMDKVEERHHDCVQIDVIEHLRNELMDDKKAKVDIARMQKQVDIVEENTKEHKLDIDKIKGGKSKLLLYVISIIITNVVIVSSIVWFLSGINTEVKVIQRDINKQTDNAALNVEDLCYQMNSDEKLRLRKLFSNKRIPVTCRE